MVRSVRKVLESASSSSFSWMYTLLGELTMRNLASLVSVPSSLRLSQPWMSHTSAQASSSKYSLVSSDVALLPGLVSTSGTPACSPRLLKSKNMRSE